MTSFMEFMICPICHKNPGSGKEALRCLVGYALIKKEIQALCIEPTFVTAHKKPDRLG